MQYQKGVHTGMVSIVSGMMYSGKWKKCENIGDI